MTGLSIFTDGGSRGNPGPSACAFIVYDSKNLIYQQGFYLGISTNNQAEYQGVIKAIEWLTEDSGRRTQDAEVSFYLDSLLVVKQMRGEFKIKDEKLKILNQNISLKITRLQKLHALAGCGQENYKLKINFAYVPRAQNSVADALVNKILDGEYENG